MLLGFDSMDFADYRLSLKSRERWHQGGNFSFAAIAEAPKRRAAWVDVALGDGCGGYSGHDFGRERRAVLRSLERDILDRGLKTSFVASDDCDAPIFEAQRILQHPNLVAYYATNPVGTFDKKLRASPIGVKDISKWLGVLKRPSRNRTSLLMCCCMAHAMPPDQDRTKHRRTFPPRIEAMLNDRNLILNRSSYESIFKTKQLHVSVEQHLRRVRRTHVIQQLTANGFPDCTLDLRTLDKFTTAMLTSTFVASPHGNGRACHREWEALAAGAVPLVDYDDSPAMASLYDGLPVVRIYDWRDVTPTFLRSHLENIHILTHQRRIGLTKLFLPFWLNEFTSHFDDVLPSSVS